MIYITQLVFVKEGKEEIFQAFEDFAIPLMEKYGGRMLYRIRPEKDTFISCESEAPYEIHVISFETEQDLRDFMNDDSRLRFIHLKEASVKAMLLVKGEKM
ncbi:MAG: DUF1330 domain-containing protein [Lewinellaceae bacterium]|nr:DUF1330 domain-containing protein [Saprospiraceae bacterium]MCB9305088.1 DUF1330 domain-containing protein [Lewinellaceae bacterium]MCB9353367.1 DUF1330 domain-containing protein [Lewinellaceae bacterium]